MADVHISLTSPGHSPAVASQVRTSRCFVILGEHTNRGGRAGNYHNSPAPHSNFLSSGGGHHPRQLVRGNDALHQFNRAAFRTSRRALPSPPSSRASPPCCLANSSRAKPPAASHVPPAAQKPSRSEERR